MFQTLEIPISHDGSTIIQGIRCEKNPMSFHQYSWNFELKVRKSQKQFMVSSILPKNEQRKSTWVIIVLLGWFFCFFANFLGELRGYHKLLSKSSDLYPHLVNAPCKLIFEIEKTVSSHNLSFVCKFLNCSASPAQKYFQKTWGKIGTQQNTVQTISDIGLPNFIIPLYFLTGDRDKIIIYGTEAISWECSTCQYTGSGSGHFFQRS